MSAAMEERRKRFAEEDCPGEDFDREMATLVEIIGQPVPAYTILPIADNDRSRQRWQAEIAYCRGYLTEPLLPGFPYLSPVEEAGENSGQAPFCANGHFVALDFGNPES